MSLPIYSYREMHHVRNSQGYESAQRAYISRAQQTGQNVHIHVEGEDSKPVYLNHNRWLVNCDCGSGAGVDFALGLSRCFECGAVHINLVIPEDRSAIEHTMSKTKDITLRNWSPGDTLS